MGIESMMGGSGGGSGGGGGSGMGMQIGGMAEQDISGYLSAALETKNLVIGADYARGNIEDAYNKQHALLDPYAKAGLADYTTLRSNVNSGAYEVAPERFQYAPEQRYGSYQQDQYTDPRFRMQTPLTDDPSYQFRLQQGQSAVDQSGSSRGSQLSGATQKALARFGQNFASTEFAASYARQRGEFESDRGFGRQSYEQDRAFGATQFSNDRAFSRDQYTQNRAFDYMNSKEYQNALRGEAANRYNRQSNLTNIGIGARDQLVGVEGQYGQDLANINLYRYGAKAAGWKAVGDVAYQQGGNLQELGGGQSGQRQVSSASSGYQPNFSSQGNGGYASSGGSQQMPYSSGSYGDFSTAFDQPNQQPYGNPNQPTQYRQY